MSRKYKQLEKIKNNPINVSFEEIDALLISFGFVSRNTGGSHFIYSHPGLTDIQDYVNIPRHKPVKVIYIKRAISAIDKINNI